MLRVGGALPFPPPCCCLGARDSEAPPAPPLGLGRPDEPLTCGFCLAGGFAGGEPDQVDVQPAEVVAAPDLARLPARPERPDPARSAETELRRVRAPARRAVALRPGRADAVVRAGLHQAR